MAEEQSSSPISIANPPIDDALGSALCASVEQLAKIRDLAIEILKEDSSPTHGNLKKVLSLETLEEHAQSLQAQVFNEVLSYGKEDNQETLSLVFNQFVKEACLLLGLEAKEMESKIFVEIERVDQGQPSGTTTSTQETCMTIYNSMPSGSDNEEMTQTDLQLDFKVSFRPIIFLDEDEMGDHEAMVLEDIAI